MPHTPRAALTPARLCVALAAGLGVFGWWGVGTAAGRRRFDEMAGIIPLGALAACGVAAAAAVTLALLGLRKSRGRKGGSRGQET